MRVGTAESYRVFVRDWWRRAEADEVGWPGGRVPYPGAPRRTIGRGLTEAEARAFAREYNRTHPPGPMSRKAEYERER